MTEKVFFCHALAIATGNLLQPVMALELTQSSLVADLVNPLADFFLHPDSDLRLGCICSRGGRLVNQWVDAGQGW